MRIDAHQHYWQLSRDDYGWLTPELPVLYRDYMPDDLEPILRTHGFDKSIAVQAAATAEETEFLLSLGDRYESIAGVVGWVDFAGNRFEQQFERLQRHPKFIGVRIMLQSEEDPEYVLRPHIVDRLRRLADRDFPVDLLVKEHQLASIVRLVKVVPGLRGVIDHIGKPDIAHRELNPWAQWINEIAANPNIYCKLSGMVTEANHQHWKVDDFDEYIDCVMRAFGSERLIYGSDWPVCLLAASYSQVLEIAGRALPHLTASEREDIFGNNALRFYRLK